MSEIPAILYHGTSLERYEKIREEGLLPTTKETMTQFTKVHHFEQHAMGEVWMTQHKKLAEFWASAAHDMFKPSVIIEISTKNLVNQEDLLVSSMFGEEKGEIMYNHRIPPENITLKSIIYPLIETWTLKRPDKIRAVPMRERLKQSKPLNSQLNNTQA